MLENVQDDTIGNVLEDNSDVSMINNTSQDMSISQKNQRILKFLKKEYDDCHEEHREKTKKINFLEKKIAEIYKVITISEKDMDPNFSLFSPVITSSGRLNDNLYEEVHEMENELQQIKFEEKKLINRLSYISDNIQCIEYSIEYLENSTINTNNSNIINNNTISNCNNSESGTGDLSNNNCEGEFGDTKEYSIENSLEDTTDCEQNYTDANRKSKLAILESHEHERSRIAMELHDSVVQNLTSLIHKTELCTRLVDKDSIRTKLELQTMISTLKNSINEIRSIIYNLKPMALDDLGLKVTLERYIKQISVYSGFDVTLTIDNDEFEDEISDIVAINLLRIIQEACNNSIKHSKGNKIDVVIDKVDDNIEVKITDNGEGYELDEDDNIIVANDSFGLEIMKERAQLLSGTVEFINSETNNASVIVKLPIN